MHSAHPIYIVNIVNCASYQTQLDELDPRLRGDDGSFTFFVIPAAAGIQSIQKTHYLN